MMKAKLTISMRLYLSVLTLFLLFAVAFIVFQQYREKQYKVSTLNIHLQDYNNLLYEALSAKDKRSTEAFLSSFIPRHSIKGLRVTIVSRGGRVLFDNQRKDYRDMGNHSGRPEIAQALKTGTGSAVDRNSMSLGHDYFYSATYYPSCGIVIRSALPYNNSLLRSLRADQHYIWFALAVVILLTIVLYRFTSRLGHNITKLNEFAARADHGDGIEAVELAGFSDDELGDTAARIVKLYLKLGRTQQEQNVLKRQLTQNVAHELKTPVASIQGYLETILENPNVDDATRRQFLERCYAQSKRLASLLNDMSMLNRMDDGADMMTFEKVNVADIIFTVQKESQFALEQKGMTMQTDLPDDISVNGNRSLLYSIFRNLTDNAIAYAGMNTAIVVRAEKIITPDAFNAEYPSLAVKSNFNQPFWHFTFSDNGTGVPPEHLGRLFERFYRVDKGRSRKMGGTGLGLAIVKNAVRVHGGAITVCNNKTGGLRFDFTLKQS